MHPAESTAANMVRKIKKATMSPVTRSLILTNLAIYALQMFAGNALVMNFALWPPGHFPISADESVGFQVWQPVSYAFLHANLLHLGLNMWGLYMFGNDIERILGPRYFLALYFGAVFTAACAQLIVVSLPAATEIYPTVGASGGVFGILLAFGLMFPRRTIMLLIPPLPIQARYFVILYGLIELINGVVGTMAGIAHFAHWGGMLGGYIVLTHWNRKRRKNS
jgi:membrane associated rhomboid family serine protease